MTTASQGGYWVGFDLGGTKMLAEAIDDNFQIRGRKRVKTKGFEGADSGLERIEKAILGALEEAKIGLSDVRGVGIGCPGPIDLKKGTLLDGPNIGWDQTPLGKRLSDRLGVPVVALNDVDAGIYGEYRFGAAQGAYTAIGVFPGTGIGGGMVHRGEIFRGLRLSCMEIGHVPLVPHGPLCGCGQHGCLESVASRLAIASEATRAAYRGQAKFLLKNTGLSLEDVRSGALKEASTEDAAVAEILLAACQRIGEVLAGVVALLCPDIIVMGGGLVEAMPDFFLEQVKKRLDERVMPAYRGSYKIVAATLEDDAACLGAAAWAKRSLEGNLVETP